MTEIRDEFRSPYSLATADSVRMNTKLSLNNRTTSAHALSATRILVEMLRKKEPPGMILNKDDGISDSPHSNIDKNNSHSSEETATEENNSQEFAQGTALSETLKIISDMEKIPVENIEHSQSE